MANLDPRSMVALSQATERVESLRLLFEIPFLAFLMIVKIFRRLGILMSV